MGELLLKNRRDFLKCFIGSAALLSGFNLYARDLVREKKLKQLTILYTNDQHSRIEPFPENDPKFAGKGGFSKRASLIQKIRQEENNILLLDAGDIFQGTPYFNYFHGELEFKLMTQMGYDAATIGNHDFDLGTDNIVKQLPHAGFSFINCNYNFEDSPLNNKVLPFKVFKKSGLKIGVLGVGIELEGLVDKKMYGNIIYNNPVECANKTAVHLKENLNCDYIICLSHLGYKYQNNKVSDLILAKESKHIDLIIGGHTHTFLNEPVTVYNNENKSILVTQVGWAGIWLGKINIFFLECNKKVFEAAANQKI